MTTAVYPGSFDPITNGHLDIAERAAALFGSVVIAVYDRPDKNLLFNVEERVALATEATKGISNITVTAFSGLVVDFIRRLKTNVMIRGLRANSDFEHEFEMALMNHKLAPDIELVCLMTSAKYQFISSSVIKEVARLGGCLEGMVPDHVAAALITKYADYIREVEKRAGRQYNTPTKGA
ncbi:MAG: pantetheine-phosphate adenylyltransferase [Dehalococcoidia bacterium]|jgi:pantetheine-phosphate adenylyltransferase|nr:pantetheine-phosphate adenylyltransferase [Dehalococcoidia bacterium]